MKKNNITMEEVHKLINKNVIKENSIVTVLGDELLTEYKVVKVKDNYPENINFIIRDFLTKKEYACGYAKINTLDGMEIMYLPEVYELDEKEVVTIEESTNVYEDVIGQLEASIGDYELEDGMRFILTNDVNEKMNNKVLTVRGVGENIELVGSRGRPKKSN